jgi:tripartite-type tricarboxylate transporter receptor subunit TctC
VPTSYELGFRIALPQFRSIVVRAGTPPDRIKVLADAFAKVAQSPEYKKFLADQFAADNSFVGADKAPRFVEEQLDDMKKVSGPGTN